MSAAKKKRESANGLGAKNLAALEALRATVPVASSFTSNSLGVWVGGRVFVDEFGDEVFVPLGKSRKDVPASGPLSFVGDGIRNVKGWLGEIAVTNMVSA